MEVIRGGITAPKGFLANGVCCGIKKSKDDLALLVSEVPAIAVAAFTQNKVKAAPVIISQRHIKNSVFRGIIVNSGNANCCNGPGGIKDAELMSLAAAKELGALKEEILVASTGVIGRPLQVKLITAAIPFLVEGVNKEGGSRFAKAVMTTDKFQKEVAAKILIGGSSVLIGGVAKGAGMICPDMATMLSFITTDAAINKAALRSAFKDAVGKSFNSISVDGATSTNDTVFMLANGLAGNKEIYKNSPSYAKFSKALEYVMSELAKMIVLDGEGATKLVRITVKNAKTDNDAKDIASSIADDALFKTSIYGEDPNWGRIAAAVGFSGADVNADKLDIYIGNKKVMSNGAGVNIDKKALEGIYKKKEIDIKIDLKLGNGSARILTCDLTHEYIDINSGYTT
ncbi:MAG: ornithine acetyltransferase [Candidatus Omnitrophica bacterium CG07_land_8_20_14_0_80_42_15]|uniref:Arginine biosynthesis bifunctional protein ArgJ n=1 Tax=Candidatus Aquitaenariimonas noxiae TaxID=1974741 RepID=A0A2J0KTH0_9BACT|nr:MAG: ornithine acetyltransferase [Candidatus Omnitrophica bacterium CG07_land_8_20_14_0_80_42_15]